MVAQLALPADTLDTIGLDDTIGAHLFDTTTGHPLRLAAQA
jgi:hypothetical protein